MTTTDADNSITVSATVAAAGASASQVAPTASAIAPMVGIAVAAPAVYTVPAITPEEACLTAERAALPANLRRPDGLPAKCLDHANDND